MSRRTDPPLASDAVSARRRAVLGALGGAGLAATGGCVQRIRSLFARDAPTQLSLTIKTLPTDADPWSIRTAGYLAERLREVGIDAQVVPEDRISLLRDVLVNQQYDLYVARSPEMDQPDILRTLLHSTYSAEPGWQNPFGYADIGVDRQLEQQREQSGKERRETLAAIQRTVARDQPLAVVAFPDEINAVRTDRFVGWADREVHTVLGYLGLSARGPDAETLRVTITDWRVSENLNPIAVEYRRDGTLTGLLYDPLGRRIDGDVRPWLAESWHWLVDSSRPVAEVTLREGVEWHDGEPITATDVAFTYRFLQDTSLGEFESPLPAPRYREQSSLVSSVEVVDDRTARVHFEPCSTDVAACAFTAPVLPAHVWEATTGRATIAGFDPGRSVTEALIWNNRSPVGSGPLRFESVARRESLVLERNDAHFLERPDLDDHLSPFRGGLDADRLEFRISPSGDTAVELVQDGTADATVGGVTPSAVPRIGRSEAVSLAVDRSRSFYHVGFNIRRSPYSNPRFRRAIARLLDKEHLVEEVFEGYAEPAASPLARHEALAPELEWTGSDPEVPFPGTDGRLDVERARDAFREAGYRYSSDGELIAS